MHLALALVITGCALRPAASINPLPQADDLTLGSHAGKVLVGLTVRPNRSGRGHLLLYLLPVEGADAATGLPVELVVAGRPVAVRGCGAACRSADVDLHGGERVEARVGGSDGGTAAFDLPRLPAAEPRALFERAQERMHRLRTFRLDQVLGPADPPVQARYSYQAPGSMQLETRGSETIWMGTTRYTRDSPGGPWRREEVGLTLDVPRFAWDAPNTPPVALHLLGASQQDGAATREVAFFMEMGKLPVWFVLWIDDDGLVRRAEMMTRGHFMEDRYHDFDAPLTIAAPPSLSS